MNKIESRHRLIRSLIMEKKIHTQQELQEHLEANGVIVTQSTLSRDMKALNLVKVSENDTSYYIINSIAPSLGKTPSFLYGGCFGHAAASSKSSRHENPAWVGSIFRCNLRRSRAATDCCYCLR